MQGKKLASNKTDVNFNLMSKFLTFRFVICQLANAEANQ